MAGSKSTWTSARRVLRILKVLKGQTIYGLSNAQIAKAINDSPANTCRAMALLEEEGMATKLETGNWAHSVGLLQIAQSHANAVATAQDRLMELNTRVATGARD